MMTLEDTDMLIPTQLFPVEIVPRAVCHCEDPVGTKQPRLHLPVMITLAEPDPYLLAESEERPTQQGERDGKKDTGSIFVLQPEERARKSHDKEQRRAHSGDKCQVCCAVQKFGTLPQARNI
jgi:hypothetical protein